MEIGATPVTAGCLVDVGGEIIEVLAPRVMDKAEGKLLAKYGPHYQGIEIMVPSVSDALEAVKERGIEILSDRGVHFYTRPSSTQGVCLQVYGGDWHAESPPAPYVNPMRSKQWWEEHPIGFRGLHHVSFACRDLEEAEHFWCRTSPAVKSATGPSGPPSWPAAVGLDIGCPVEIVAPAGPGPIDDYLNRYGPGLWSITFAVRDLKQTAGYFRRCSAGSNCCLETHLSQ